MTWLNEDFCKSAEADYFLKECITTKKYVPPGNFLQISQIVNISIPKKNRDSEASLSHDPKNSVLRIILTDGKASISGLLTSYHPHLSSSTVPGTKVEILQEIPITSNFLILSPQNTRVLGGVVPALVDQWKMQLTTERMKSWGFRGNLLSGDGPPQWKPFSLRGSSNNQVNINELRNVKAMDIVKEQKEAQKGADDPSKTLFEAQRQETISELAKKTQAKQFGEGKRLIDKGVQDIINEGFTEEEAAEALRKFRNPQKAIKYLKGIVRSRESNIGRLREAERDKDLLRGSKKGGRRDREDDGPTGNDGGEQPSSNISLFGFIQQKMKKEDESTAPKKTPVEAPVESSYRGGKSVYPEEKNSLNNPRSDYRHSSSDQDYRNDRNSSEGRWNQKPRQDQSHDFTGPAHSTQDYRSDRRNMPPSRGGYSSRGGFRGSDSHSQSGFDPRNNSGDFSKRNDSRNGRSDRTNFTSSVIKHNQGFSRPGSQRDQPPNPMPVMNTEATKTFAGLKSSHFPSLSDEPAPSRPQAVVSGTQRQSGNPRPPAGDYYQGGDNYPNSNRYGRKETQFSHPQSHQTYPSRNRGGYDSYERTPRQEDWHTGGDRMKQQQYNYDQGQDQFNQQFSNLSVRPDYGRENSTDWRPSHTMVFSRTRNSGTAPVNRNRYNS